MRRPALICLAALTLAAVAGLPKYASAQTTFVQDTFTAANSTLLSAHNPDVGNAGSWTALQSSLQIQNNSLQNTASKTLAGYTNSTPPTGGVAEYVVGVTAMWPTSAKTTDIVTLAARVNGAWFDRYEATINNGSTVGNVVVRKIVGGVTTTLATGNFAVTLNTATYLAFSVTNASKQFLINGTAIVSTTDNTITTAGVAGIAMEGNAIGDTVCDDYYESTFASTAVKLTSLTATRYDDRVFLKWRTGYEVDNLGFRLYREAAGVRTRITPSLIAGSGLLVGHGTATNAGHTYGWWDASAADPASATYWLEDVGLNGQTTWHGPVGVDAAGSEVPPNIDSRLLNQLTRPGAGPATPPGQSRSSASSRLFAAPTETYPVLGDAVASGPALKVSVNAEGWYRVPRMAVAAAGVRAVGDSMRLLVDGVDQPYRLTADAIEFYGTGVDTPYTDTRVYWVSTGGAANRRVPVVAAGTRQAPTATSFPFTLEHKDREIYFAALLNGDTENFFGELVMTDPTDIALPVVHLDPAFAGTALLEVVLQGVTEIADAPDGHHVDVQLNGSRVGSVDFSGRDHVSTTFEVPSAQLVEGDNHVTVMATGGDMDITLVDRIRLTYAHTYTADGDRLRFTALGGQPTVVGGFSSGAIRVVDVTDPANVVELSGHVSGKADGFQVALNVPDGGTRTLLAFTDASIWMPAALEANQPSAWADARNAADYVIIAPAEFRDAVRPLETLRQSQGHRVAVVDIEDVYDEFSFGQKTPYAIRDFLVRAHAAWRVPPRFVVLVGNATNDPRNYLGMDEPDWVPTKLVDATVFETASDDWFADTNGDGLPELAAIGRLPARTSDQAAAMVQKIVAYEAAYAAGWTKQVTLVADASDSGDSDFAATTSQVRAMLPADYAVTELSRGALGTDATRAALLANVNAGQAIVHYTGHGSVDIWHDDVLTTDDAPALTNGAQLPLFVMMDCLNGYFQGLFPEESLAEALMRAPNGGAVAVWASSGFTEAANQVPLSTAFYRLLFSGKYATLGQVIGAAKASATDRDVRRTWILFGDPAQQLKGLPK